MYYQSNEIIERLQQDYPQSIKMAYLQSLDQIISSMSKDELQQFPIQKLNSIDESNLQEYIQQCILTYQQRQFYYQSNAIVVPMTQSFGQVSQQSSLYNSTQISDSCITAHFGYQSITQSSDDNKEQNNNQSIVDRMVQSEIIK